jgi:hypothetical protein
VKHAGQGAEQCGFAESGDAFEEHVAACQKADHDSVDDFLLADDDFGDFLADAVEFGRCLGETFLNTHDTIVFDWFHLCCHTYVRFGRLDSWAAIWYRLFPRLLLRCSLEDANRLANGYGEGDSGKLN